MARAVHRIWRDLWHRLPRTGSGGRESCRGHLAVRPRLSMVEPFLVSTLVVGLAEIGDKTQILSLILAARFQRPAPIIFGILFATIANHAAAGLVGTLFGNLLGGSVLRWVLGASFSASPYGRCSRTDTRVSQKQSVVQARSSRPSSPSSLPRSATRRRSPRLASRRGSISSTRSSSARPSE